MILPEASSRGPDKTTRLAQSVQALITAGQLAAGDMLPSERELMLMHNLSRTTVRRGIQLLVDSGAVVRRAGSGTFVADIPVRPVVETGASPTISLIIPTFSNPLYAQMIDGIEQEARRAGMRLITNQSFNSVDSESQQLAALANDPSVRGAIVVPAMVESASPGARRFLATGRTLVYLGRWPRGLAADGVSADYLEAAKIAVEHLIALGHRQIAYVEGTPHLPGFSLIDGYKAALREAHAAAPKTLQRIYDLSSEEAGRQAVADMIAESVSFTAVFARNDVTAIGVAHALRSAGLDIPRDVAVASVNNSLLARSTTPPLTSVNIFPEEIGRLAFRLLRERMDGGETGPPIHITVTPELVVRTSTVGGTEPAV